MNKDYTDAILGGGIDHDGNSEQFELLQQYALYKKELKKAKKKFKKSKKKGGKKTKKLKKRIKSLKKQRDQMRNLLEMATYEKSKPKAYNLLSETILMCTPKLVDLGTEVMRGINQKRK